MNAPVPDSGVHLVSYLQRIRSPEAGTPRLDTLRHLHSAHLAAIPFENLDQRLGRPVDLDLSSLQDKIVRRRRGGYCFEQNTLFAAVLRDLGFAVDTLEARVRPIGVTAPLPRTHMTLRVRIEDRDWLADVGFGGDGPFLPVPVDGQISEQAGESYQVVRENDYFVLRGTIMGKWRDLYAFRPEPALPVDFELAHYYTATHPRSRFRQTLTVQRSTLTDRYRLRGRTYERTGPDPETRTNLTDEEAHRIVTEVMKLEVSVEDIRTALSE